MIVFVATSSSDMNGSATLFLYFHCIGDRPTLPELIRFNGVERRINIPQEIGTKYTTFGILLLEDKSGMRIETIAHKHMKDAEKINIEVLQEWIAGRGLCPVTWQTLTDVLCDVELSVLAKEIQNVKSQLT